MAGVAIAYRWPRRHSVRKRRKLSLRFQAIGFRIVELRAVDIQCARNMTIGLRSRRFLFAEEERGRSCVDKCSAAFSFDALNIAGFGQNALVDRCRENLW